MSDPTEPTPGNPTPGNPAEAALLDDLRGIEAIAAKCSRRPGDGLYTCPHDFVIRHGRFYAPTDCDEKGAPRCCFGNAIMLCVKYPGLVYVEGYALTPDGIPFLHAWATGPAGHPAEGLAIDITWPLGLAYLGVAFSLDRADDATWNGDGCILDDWKRRWPLFREPWAGERPLPGYQPTPGLILARRKMAWRAQARARRGLAPETIDLDPELLPCKRT